MIGGSGYFDGSGDYLGCGSQSAYAFGTGDFTLNVWVYLTSAPTYMSIADTRGPGWALAIDANRAIYLYSDIGGVFIVTSAVGAVPLNAWTYVTVKRVSGTMTLYLNAVSINSAASAQNFSHTTLAVGANTAGGEPFFGYISDFQAIKGTGTTPTLPTAPLTNVTNTSLLLNYTNGAIFDNAMMNDLETVGNAQISTSVVKYGTGSMAFDGTGDYLIGQVSPNLSFGTGNFTIEGWAYVTNTGTTFQCMLSIGAPVQIYARSGTIKIYFNDTDDTTTYIVNGAEGPASSVSPNTWFHFAVVRNGTTFSAYVNGVAGTPTTGISDQVALSANPISLGIYGATSTLPFTGYMDDIRITKGYARYTANFTPPTAAFPNIGPY